MTAPEHAERTPSEQEWLRVNAYLQRNRYDLAVRAAEDFPPETRVAGTPLLAAPAWRPAAPIPLTSIRLEFRPDAPVPDAPVPDAPVPDAPVPAAGPDVAAVAPDLLPLRADG